MRCLFNTLCLLSLVLGMAVAVLWARSAWWGDSDFLYCFVERNDSMAWYAASDRGSIALVYAPLRLQQLARDGHFSVDHSLLRLRWMPRVWWEQGTIDKRLSLPNWALLLATTAAPAWWLTRRRGASPGGCPRCGYALRATVSPTCPECGAAIAHTPA